VKVMLRDGPREVMLVTRDQLLEFHSQAAALAFLRRFMMDPVNRMRLRHALAEERTPINLSRLEDHDILERLAERLASGQVKLVSWPNVLGLQEVNFEIQFEGTVQEMTPREAEEAAREEAEAEAAAAQEEEATWLEIELLDDEGKPVPGEQYQVALPDGTIRAGRLDADGRARIEGLDPGTCKVSFPNLDERSWKFVQKQ